MSPIYATPLICADLNRDEAKKNRKKNQNVEFCTSGIHIMAMVTKLERFLQKNQHTHRKLLNFENWVNTELSKIGHQFRK